MLFLILDCCFFIYKYELSEIKLYIEPISLVYLVLFSHILSNLYRIALTTKRLHTPAFTIYTSHTN